VCGKVSDVKDFRLTLELYVKISRAYKCLLTVAVGQLFIYPACINLLGNIITGCRNYNSAPRENITSLLSARKTANIIAKNFSFCKMQLMV
jgi:hypothetical protein